MFDPKTPTEKESFGFDFTGLLAAGETIQAGQTVVTVHVIRGTDPSPQSMVVGSPTVNGAIVSILIGGGVEGVIYCLKCKIVTSNGQELELTGDLLVREPC